MNTNLIFEQFDSSSDEKPKDFKQHPIYNILMFKKIMVNYLKMKDISISEIKKAHPELDEKDINTAYSYINYSRAFYYLNFLDLNNPSELEYIIENKIELKETLIDLLRYFIKHEEYEKCVFIRDLLNKCGIEFS